MDQVSDDEEGGGELVPLGAMLEAIEEEETRHTEHARALARRVADEVQPMYVTDAERSVLSAMLLDAGRAVPLIEDAGLRETDFYVERHRMIFAAILRLAEKGRHVDAITVVDALNRRAQLDAIGGAQTVSDLEALLPSPMAAGGHARMVVEKSKLRAVTMAAAETLERARHGHKVDDVVDSLEVAIEEAHRVRGGTGFVDLPDAVRRTLGRLPAMGAEVAGIRTGFADVDRLFRFVPGDLVIVAGRPSMGKTQWVVDCVRECTVSRGEPAAFFSLEMSDEQVMNRLIGSRSKLDLKRLQMPGHELIELQGAAGEVGEAPLFLDDSPSISVGEIRARARAAHRRIPLSLIIVDYIQLVDIPDASGNSSVDLGRVSKGLKQLARELRATVIALSQLNRGVEARSDKRPLMSDLRESGNLEQDADVIAFLYREEYYAKGKTPDDQRGIAEVIVGKNRNGPTGAATLRFDVNIPRFDNLAREGW